MDIQVNIQEDIRESIQGDIREIRKGLKRLSLEKKIILVGYVGLEGSLKIAKEKEEELRSYFSKHFMNQVKKCKEHLISSQVLDEIKGKEGHSEENEEDILISLGADEKSKSLWSAMWHFCETYETGFEIESFLIPIRQETIEICQFARLNPYQLSSGGSHLIITSQWEKVMLKLKEDRVVSEIIGETTKKKARLIKRGDYIRHLPRPESRSPTRETPLAGRVERQKAVSYSINEEAK